MCGGCAVQANPPPCGWGFGWPHLGAAGGFWGTNEPSPPPVGGTNTPPPVGGTNLPLWCCGCCLLPAAVPRPVELWMLIVTDYYRL